MIKLKDWHFSKCMRGDTQGEYFRAHGIVTGHPKLEDGISITTSMIEKIKLDAEKNRLLMYTHSQNEYELLISEISEHEFDITQEYLKIFEVPEISWEQYKKLRESYEQDLAQEIERELDCNELYLQFSGVFVQEAFWCNSSGEVRKINVRQHIGTLQDSYLITDWEKGEVDFRYFDGFNSIQPYHWSDGLQTIVIKVISSDDLNFEGSERNITCKAGETTRIQRKEYRGEGLFSPDVVNGKCIFYLGEEKK